MSVHELHRRYGIRDRYMVLVATAVLLLGLFIVMKPMVEMVHTAPFAPRWRNWALIIGGSVAVFALAAAWHARRQCERTSRAREAQSAMERPRYDALKADVAELLTRSQVTVPVELRCFLFSDEAEAQVDRAGGSLRIVFANGLVKLHKAHPERALSIVAHEISHLELDDLASAHFGRLALQTYFYCLTAAGAILLTVTMLDPAFLFAIPEAVPTAAAVLVKASGASPVHFSPST